MSTTLKRIATTAVTAITMALIFVFDSVAIIASEPGPTITLPENSWDNSVEIAPGTSVDLPDPSRDEAINKALTNDNKDIIKNYYNQSFADDAALNAAIEGATVNNYSYSQGYVNGEDHRSAIGSPDLNEGYYDCKR